MRGGSWERMGRLRGKWDEKRWVDAGCWRGGIPKGEVGFVAFLRRCGRPAAGASFAELTLILSELHHRWFELRARGKGNIYIHGVPRKWEKG